MAAGGLFAIVAAAGPAAAQGWFDTSPEPPQAASAADVAELTLRIDRLEELVRRLTGELEELRHRVAVGGEPPAAAAAAPPQQPRTLAEAYQGTPSQPAAPQDWSWPPATPSGPVAATEPGAPTSLLPPSPYAPSGSEAVGAPPRPLGQIPESALRGAQGALGAVSATADPGYAAGPVEGSAEAAYNAAYGLLLQQDFAGAEHAFATFLDNYPSHPLAGNAQYWLAETYYARGDYRQAAQGFLEGYQTYSSSPKAPDSLLKLGMTLAALGQKEQACASYAEVAARFPNADPEVRDRASSEQQRAGC